MATSQKVDIVDSFEKRIKSRFSGRMTLFYQEHLQDFIITVRDMFTENFTKPFELKKEQQRLSGIVNECGEAEEQEAYDFVQEMLRSNQLVKFLETSFECGK